MTILAVGPESWRANVQGWFSLLGPYRSEFLAFASGGLIGALGLGVYRAVAKRRGGALRLLTGSEVEELFRRLIDGKRYNLIKVFGYTGETVIADLMRYEDRYEADLEVRLLHRSWLLEREDENAHNLQPQSSQRRPWRKWKAIRALGLERWQHLMGRDIKYYQHQPILKGCILCQRRGGRRTGFLTFQKWVRFPEEGGSPFKGSKMVTLFVPGATSREREYLGYLESQFDYEWAHGLTAQELEDKDSGSETLQTESPSEVRPEKPVERRHEQDQRAGMKRPAGEQ